MDIRYPYADPLSRLQLLYRLPSAPLPRRLLVVSGADSGADIGAGWGAGAVTRSEPAALLQRGPQGEQAFERFDAVALPDTLRPRSSIGNAALLAAAARLLRPGGVVVGHLEHGRALRRLARPAGLAAWMASAFNRDAINGPAACRRVLVRAGFEDAECYYVQPHVDAPMGLIPSEPAAARRHFLRAVRSARHSSRFGAAELRLALAWLGGGGSFQSQLFFWARKPC